jgi:hypothetical protein
MVGYGGQPSTGSSPPVPPVYPATVNVFSVTADGKSWSPGGSQTGGADYAEWLESDDGQHYPPGTSVTFLESGKFRRSVGASIRCY